VNSVLLLALSVAIIMYTGTKIAYIDCCGDIEYEWREGSRRSRDSRATSHDRMGLMASA
jgi:hypothetical protein